MNAILVIAYRDFIKLLRDPTRIAASLIFPALFIAILGKSMQGTTVHGYNYIAFVFTGVYANTLFQSAALGIVSLVEDRENDFTQEIFVSPVSRYAIIIGKILGESLVAMVQGLAVLVLGFVLGVPLTLVTVGALLVLGLVVCIFGGSFGLVILSRLKSQRAANQIFPFIFFPQFFLAGLFSPIKSPPSPVELVALSFFAPLRYAADLVRGVYYKTVLQSESATVVLWPWWQNAIAIGLIFAVCLITGTFLFVRSEKNR